MKRTISVLMAGTMLVGNVVSVSPIANADEVSYKRLSGLDRYETCSRICRDKFKSAKVAILASGEDYPDALSSGALSIKEKAPLLLIKKDEIPSSIQKEMDRLKIEKVIVIGGENTISKQLFDSISKKYKAERIAGKDRFETSLNIAKLTAKDGSIIVNGLNYSDALIATSLGAKLKKNILLTNGVSLNEVQKNFLKDKENIILGGEKSVSIEGLKAKRIAGKDRYETSLRVAEQYFKDNKNLIVASGKVFADALSSVSLMTDTIKPIILVNNLKNSDTPLIKKYLENKKINVDIIGGDKTISENLVKKILGEKQVVEEKRGGGSSSGSSSHKKKKIMYADGIFKGAGKGFRSGYLEGYSDRDMQVEVSIKDNNIEDIKLIKYGDDNATVKYKEFAEKFFKEHVPEIKKKRNAHYLFVKLLDCIRTLEQEHKRTDVSTGATFSNIGIMEAVDNALNASELEYKTGEKDYSKDIILKHVPNEVEGQEEAGSIPKSNLFKVGDTIKVSDFTIEKRYWDPKQGENKLIEGKDFEKEGIKVYVVPDIFYSKKKDWKEIKNGEYNIKKKDTLNFYKRDFVNIRIVDEKTGQYANYFAIVKLQDPKPNPNPNPNPNPDPIVDPEPEPGQINIDKLGGIDISKDPEDTVYYVMPVILMHSFENRPSNGNGALVQTTVVKKVEDGYQYYATFDGIEVMGMRGHLWGLEIYKNKIKSELTEATVDKYYKDRGLFGVQDKTFPNRFTFVRPEKDKTVYVKVFVDAMDALQSNNPENYEQIGYGNGSQNARLVFDWDKAEKIEKKDIKVEVEPDPEPTDANNLEKSEYIRERTGFEKANKNVFKITVTDKAISKVEMTKFSDSQGDFETKYRKNEDFINNKIAEFIEKYKDKSNSALLTYLKKLDKSLDDSIKADNFSAIDVTSGASVTTKSMVETLIDLLEGK